MKKVFTFAIVAVAAWMAVSCTEILDSLSKNPVFEMTNSKVYDGQKAFLGTTATCKIGWSTDAPGVVTFDHDENGKNCTAWFNLPADEIKEVHVTATNLDDESVDPYTGSFTIVPWKLTVCQKSGNEWKVVSRSNEPYFLWSERVDAGSSSFKVQMQALKSDGTFEDIENVTYKISLKDNSQKIDWQGTALPESQKGETTACSREFTIDKAPTATLSITAKLGAKTKEIKILAK